MDINFEISEEDEITLHGLEKWTNDLYEKLGWMTLAYDMNKEDKIISYVTSIKKLKLSIESRLKIIINEDSKLDLATLLNNVKHLYKVAFKLFNKDSTVCDNCSNLIINKNSFYLNEKTNDDSNLLKKKLKKNIPKKKIIKKKSKK